MREPKDAFYETDDDEEELEFGDPIKCSELLK
jgi:hypothetical protein